MKGQQYFQLLHSDSIAETKQFTPVIIRTSRHSTMMHPALKL